MKKLAILISIIGILMIGCSSKSLHPPKHQTLKINTIANWLDSPTIGFLYESTKDYDITKDQSSMLWIEEVINKGKEAKTIVGTEQQNWVRKFYAQYLFDKVKVNSFNDFKNEVEKYSINNPPPIKEIITVDAIINASGNLNS